MPAPAAPPSLALFFIHRLPLDAAVEALAIAIAADRAAGAIKVVLEP